MVAEVVPARRRVEAGALLYTSAPAGLFLATFANFQIAGVFLKAAPATSWRYVFLCGLLPAVVAFALRLFVHEPEAWKRAAAGAPPPRLRELFSPGVRRLTLSGFAMSLVALITWWTCAAFLAIVASGLAQTAARQRGLDVPGTLALVESWKARTTNFFNLGGLLGTLLTIPAAKVFGRRKMFGIYYALSAVATFATFGLDLPPETRLAMYFFEGLTVFGVFGAFTYYLPELFPTRLRGTGSGFCYNVGRIITAVGPFVVANVATRGADALGAALKVLTAVAIVPALGSLMALFAPFVVETKGRATDELPDGGQA